jgi:hypothetical protein
MHTQSLTDLASKLSDVSRKNLYSPYVNLEFPDEIDRNQWFTSPELLSLYGTSAYDELSEERKKALSFWEAVNFYSINIHGEKALMEGLARRLYEKKNEKISNYLHHFLDEENKHMVYFGTFTTRYAGKVYPDRKMNFPREYEEGEEDFLFFAKVMIFEEIVDHYNKKMSTDQRLHPVAQKINLFHHRDEIRHLVFGRQLVKELWQAHVPRWGAEKVEQIREYLTHYMMATWREYYNPDVYRDVGFSNPYDIAESAFLATSSRKHRQAVTQNCIDYLKECEILLEDPKL